MKQMPKRQWMPTPMPSAVAGEHLLTCPHCGATNGITAFSCWCCDKGLPPELPFEEGQQALLAHEAPTPAEIEMVSLALAQRARRVRLHSSNAPSMVDPLSGESGPAHPRLPEPSRAAEPIRFPTPRHARRNRPVRTAAPAVGRTPPSDASKPIGSAVVAHETPRLGSEEIRIRFSPKPPQALWQRRPSIATSLMAVAMVAGVAFYLVPRGPSASDWTPEAISALAAQDPTLDAQALIDREPTGAGLRSAPLAGVSRGEPVTRPQLIGTLVEDTNATTPAAAKRSSAQAAIDRADALLPPSAGGRTTVQRAEAPAAPRGAPRESSAVVAYQAPTPPVASCTATVEALGLCSRGLVSNPPAAAQPAGR
ncbi:MAG: hypothetical protein JWP52_3479 [Rhizobacter sp.]|nr:hypothetical protein [Rhizobacter sp.]